MKNFKALPYHASGGKFTKSQFKKRTAMSKKLIARVNRAQKSGQPLQVARFVYARHSGQSAGLRD
jgi:hypothetical protein